MATSKFDVLDFLAQKSNIGGSAVAVLTMLGGGFLLSLEPIPALGLGVGGYVAGFLIFGQPKQSIDIVASNSEVEVKTIQANISKLRLSIDEHAARIPDEIMTESENIFGILEEIIPRWKDLNSFAEQKYTINAVITDYFPEIITNYMNLPKSYYRNGAKSKAAAEIVEQLGILRKALEDIRNNLYKGVENDITVQGQFLKEKFASNDSGRLRLQ